MKDRVEIVRNNGVVFNSENTIIRINGRQVNGVTHFAIYDSSNRADADRGPYADPHLFITARLGANDRPLKHFFNPDNIDFDNIVMYDRNHVENRNIGRGQEDNTYIESIRVHKRNIRLDLKMKAEVQEELFAESI